MSIRLVNPGNHMPGHGSSGKRKKAVDKQRISTCKACRHGVYDDEEHMWGRGLLLGICHTECVQAEARRVALLAELHRERHGDGSQP